MKSIAGIALGATRRQGVSEYQLADTFYFMNSGQFARTLNEAKDLEQLRRTDLTYGTLSEVGEYVPF